MSQWHCIVQGQQYGPVDDSTVRDWIRSGRVQPSDNVWTEGMAQWLPAAQVPALAGSFSDPNRITAAPIQRDPREADVSGVYAYPESFNRDPDAMDPYARNMPNKPHRSGTVLTLGILGVLCCGICAVVAWTMGSSDIKEMDAGVMDPSGRGATQAGKILGIVGTILWIIGVVVNLGSLAVTS